MPHPLALVGEIARNQRIRAITGFDLLIGCLGAPVSRESH